MRLPAVVPLVLTLLTSSAMTPLTAVVKFGPLVLDRRETTNSIHLIWWQNLSLLLGGARVMVWRVPLTVCRLWRRTESRNTGLKNTLKGTSCLSLYDVAVPVTERATPSSECLPFPIRWLIKLTPMKPLSIPTTSRNRHGMKGQHPVKALLPAHVLQAVGRTNRVVSPLRLTVQCPPRLTLSLFCPLRTCRRATHLGPAFRSEVCILK